MEGLIEVHFAVGVGILQACDEFLCFQIVADYLLRLNMVSLSVDLAHFHYLFCFTVVSVAKLLEVYGGLPRSHFDHARTLH